MTKLELLYALKSKKFDQLGALVARELGYDELSILTAESGRGLWPRPRGR